MGVIKLFFCLVQFYGHERLRKVDLLEQNHCSRGLTASCQYAPLIMLRGYFLYRGAVRNE